MHSSISKLTEHFGAKIPAKITSTTVTMFDDSMIPQAFFRSFRGFRRYDRSCGTMFVSNTSITVKDASCAAHLVCARKGHEGREFGDCPGHHCCSVAHTRTEKRYQHDPFLYSDAAAALVRSLAGKWAPALEDRSAWMTGLKIAEDGLFECRSGRITDGLVRVLSVSDRTINLKRTCADANDHVLIVDEDAGRMVGRCIQSGTTYTLTRVPDSEEGTFRV